MSLFVVGITCLAPGQSGEAGEHRGSGETPIDIAVLHATATECGDRKLAQDVTEAPTGPRPGFAPLTRTEGGRVVVGGGPYMGESWPEAMVNNAGAGELEGIRCPIVSAAAQIEIKRMMPMWVPGFRRWDKDTRYIATLEFL